MTECKVIFIRDKHPIYSLNIGFVPDAMILESINENSILSKRYDLFNDPLEKYKEEVLEFLKEKYPEDFI